MKDFVEKLLTEKEAEYDNITNWFAEKYMDCEDDNLVEENETLQTKLNTEINLLYVILGN
jgi:C4-dicarboxylate transporter